MLTQVEIKFNLYFRCAHYELCLAYFGRNCRLIWLRYVFTFWLCFKHCPNIWWVSGKLLYTRCLRGVMAGLTVAYPAHLVVASLTFLSTRDPAAIRPLPEEVPERLDGGRKNSTRAMAHTGYRYRKQLQKCYTKIREGGYRVQNYLNTI